MPPLVRTIRAAVLATLVAAATFTGVVGPPTPVSAATPPPGPISEPPMGWNSWNRFGCDIDENLIKSTADALVSTGLRDAGYTYVNIDDCWMASTRDAQGRLQPHATRFPGGIKALADYVHARGLKLGIYESAGTATCQGLPGSLDHETVDAQSFASWGIDLLKYDNCNNQGRPDVDRYRAMGEALRATGRPIVYSICNWGNAEPWLFAPTVGGSLWRTTGDISDSWASMTSLLDQQAGLELFARKGFYNDPDMLEVGNGGMTETEYRAHFSLWALLSSPLLLGNDLRSMPTHALSIVSDRDVIAVNQDWGGSQGRRVADFGETEVWAKPMSDGSAVVVLFNRTGASTSVATTAAELGLGGSSQYAVKDLWSKATFTSTGAISATVPSHGVVMYRVTRAGSLASPPAAGTFQVSDQEWLASSNGWGPAERDRSNGEQAAGDGGTIKIGSRTFSKGIGTHADSAIHVFLGRACRTFSAQVGIDAEVSGNGSVRFAVYGDGQLLGYTSVKSGGQEPTTLAVSTAGYLALELRTTIARNDDRYDHADWGSPTLVCGGGGAGSFVSDRAWSSATNGWGAVERDLSNGEQATSDGGVQTVNGASYPKGVGTHADADVAIAVSGCSRFTGVLGVDAEVNGQGSVVFSLVADGATLYTSPTVTTTSPVPVDVDITGHTTLHLVVGDSGDGKNYDHADWAGARLAC